MSSRAELSPPVSIVAAITVGDPAAISNTLAAISGQVYEPARVVVVGGDTDGRHAADEEGAEWAASLSALLASLAADVSHVWVLRAGSIPRPDALDTLIEGAERTGSAVAGSKVLQLENPESLMSVGIATDVFDTPYLGLDDDEIDAGQYDVVRDVAAVSGASMLIRRDLAKGVAGPDPLLPRQAAAIDLCQRARLRGARVVVVPSSEVLFPLAATGPRPWREEAGRIRAMLKVYSFLTLLWTIPLDFLIGLLQAIVAPFLGRWTLFAWVKSWLWNIFHLPSTLRERFAARKGRVVGDAELFRYQLRGSATLRSLSTEVSTRLRHRVGSDEALTLASLGRDLRQPALVIGLMSLVVIGLATRSIWADGLPAVGYSLPLPASGGDTLRAYAGGWNPSGFGSVEALRPFLAAAGLIQVAVFDNARWASTILVTGSMVAGVWGANRLLRTWGIEAVPGALAGAVLVAGPATRAIAQDTNVPTLVAVGLLPWAIRVAVARWPETRRRQIGRVAGAVWVTALVAVLSPPLVIVPFGAVLVWALLNLRDDAVWRSALVSGVATLVAFAALLPWITNADLNALLNAGEAFWDPGVVLVGAIAIAFGTVLFAAPSRLADVAAWGGVLAVLGALVARSADLGGGREVEGLGLALVALGSAAIVGASFEAVRRVDEVTGWRRLIIGLGAVAAAVVLGATLLVVAPGRAGLPGDTLTRQIGFTGLSSGDATASRILLIGPQDKLPGDSATIQGAGYRVVSAPMPPLTEAWLPEPTSVDAALALVLEDLISGETFRAGEQLAPFGIRWVISVGETPLEEVFDGQLDLIPLSTPEGVALTMEEIVPVRAYRADGEPWARSGAGYIGPAGPGTVFVAETANGRWGPDWQQAEWGNQLSAVDGRVGFETIPSRRNQAVAAGVLVLVLIGVSWWGRRG